MLESFSVSPNVQVQAASTRLFIFWGMAVTYFSMIIMISPLLLKEITGADAAAEWQGTLTSATAASGLVLCGILGYLSDRYGRLIFIRIWTVFFFASSVCLIHSETSKTVGGLLFARLVPFSVASALTYALAADIASDSSEVLKAHASLGATFSSAMLLGNVITAGLGFFVQRVYVLFLGSLMVMGASYMAFFSIHANNGHQRKNDSMNKDSSTTRSDDNNTEFDEDEIRGGGVMSPTIVMTKDFDDLIKNSNNNHSDNEINHHHSATAPKSTAEELSWFAALAILRKDPLLRNLVFAYSLFRCANVNFFAVFVLFVDRRFGWQLQQIAVFLISVGLVGAACQAIIVRWMNGHLAELSPIEGGQKVLRLFFALLLLAPVLSLLIGAAPSGNFLSLCSLPAGAAAILPALFTSKISSLSKQDGLTGFSLGLVGSLQNLIESFLGVIWGKMLSYAIVHYDANSFAFGLPYYVNAAVYFSVFVIVYYSHHVHGKHRSLWMENEASSYSTKDPSNKSEVVIVPDEQDESLKEETRFVKSLSSSSLNEELKKE